MCALLPDNDPALHKALAESYKRAFQTLRADGHVNEPLFPGIARLLDEIDARGWLMGVATGKSDRGLGLCLAHHGIGSRFVTLLTADRHPSQDRKRVAQGKSGSGRVDVGGRGLIKNNNIYLITY